MLFAWVTLLVVQYSRVTTKLFQEIHLNVIYLPSNSSGTFYKDSKKATSIFFLEWYNFIALVQSARGMNLYLGVEDDQDPLGAHLLRTFQYLARNGLPCLLSTAPCFFWERVRLHVVVLKIIVRIA